MEKKNANQSSNNPIKEFVCLLSLLAKIIAIKGESVLTERIDKDEKSKSKN